MVLTALLEIHRSKSIEEMEFAIAEILRVVGDDPDSKEVVESIARVKARNEGWVARGSNYRIPNVNGLGRPLTVSEIEEIIMEDMRGNGYGKRGI